MSHRNKQRRMYAVANLERWTSLQYPDGSSPAFDGSAVGFIPVYATKKAARAVYGTNCRLMEIAVQELAGGKR